MRHPVVPAFNFRSFASLMLISFVMIITAAASFFCRGDINSFLGLSLNGDCSTRMHLARLLPCVMVSAASIAKMHSIQSSTQAIVGGAYGLASGPRNKISGSASSSTEGEGAR